MKHLCNNYLNKELIALDAQKNFKEISFNIGRNVQENNFLRNAKFVAFMEKPNLIISAKENLLSSIKIIVS